MKKFTSSSRFVLPTLLVLGFLFTNASQIFAATSGPIIPSTVSDSNAVGNKTWSNPSSAKNSNNNYATVKLTSSSDQTHYLKTSNVGFSIPAGSTINGIQVSIERKQACDEGGCSSTVTDTIVKLVKGGTVVGNNKASATSWPTSDTVASYGSTSDLWGTTWSVSEINNSGFGVVLSAERSSGGDRILSVDNMTITVTYTAPVSNVKVTISKYLNGAQATAGNTSSASFPMSATWSATNIGSGTGSYALSTTGYNNPDAYKATTSDMSSGANYSTEETASTSCTAEYPFSFVGYSTGNTIEEASVGLVSVTIPSFTNITSDKFVIVWNKTCPPAPVHVSPADNTNTTTALQTLIDWSDVTTDPSTPITYIYEASNSATTNPDGSFTSAIYTSGVLTTSEIPTPGTGAGVYYWHVKAIDAAGNSGPWSNAWKITIDNTAPSIPTLLTPETDTIIGTNDFNFTWEPSTDTEGSPITYQFHSSLNSAESDDILTTDLWTSGTLNDPMIHSTGAPDGKWYWQVRAQDASGNWSGWSAIWNVTLDTTAPVITVPTEVSVETGEEGDVIVNFTATAVDAVDEESTVTCDPISGSTFSGTTVVTCTSTDSHGNTGTASFTVIVNGVSGPVLILPGNITTEATSGAGAEVTYGATAYYLEAEIDISCTPASGSTFSISTTTVECLASNIDEPITISTGSFTVTVVDTTKPVITLLGTTPVSVTIGDSYTDAGATASDIVDGDITANIVLGGSVNTSTLGTYVLTYNVTDAHGNAATEVIRTVNVVPKAPHTITVSQGANGVISPEGEEGGVVVADGENQTFTITADPEFHVLDVLVDGESVGAVTTYTFTEVTANHSISATFEAESNSTSGSIPTAGRVLGASIEKGEVLGAEKFIFTQYMKLGSKNGEVDELQKFLNDAGYNCGAVDGIFGTKTDACVRAYQKANPPLKVDGIVGPLTRAVLNK